MISDRAVTAGTADQACKAEQFRRMHVLGDPLILFNVWDAGSARAVAASGRPNAIAMSSWAVLSANGFADGEHIPLSFVINNLRRIVSVADPMEHGLT